jgi:Rieske Fe-S protein
MIMAEESKKSAEKPSEAPGFDPGPEAVPLSVKPPERRDFLLRLGVALNVVAAACVGVPVAGFVLSGVRSRAYSSWVKLGPVRRFPEGETRKGTYINPYTVPWDGDTAHIPCWVRHIEGDKFQVFAVNCTHLGCPVRWFPQSGLFMCPCHGGVFYEDGMRASGPPPRRLYEYEYKVENGDLLVRAGHLPTIRRTLKEDEKVEGHS